MGQCSPGGDHMDLFEFDPAAIGGAFLLGGFGYLYAIILFCF